MVTLLFAVFVVLYALKQDGEKSQDASGSIEESFNKPLEDIPPAQRVGPTDAGFGVFEHLRGESIRAPMIKKFPEIKQRIKLIDDEMNKTKGQLDVRLYGENKFREEKDPGTSRIVSVERTEMGFKVTLLARHFYAPGAVDIKESAKGDLDNVISVLKQLGRNIRVEGHTDNSSAEKMNHWELSTLRATRVLEYMIKRHNFPPSLLSAAGYGDTKPMATNATEKTRALNRRVEFLVRYDDESSMDIRQ